jgi:hypothetical protein
MTQIRFLDRLFIGARQAAEGAVNATSVPMDFGVLNVPYWIPGTPDYGFTFSETLSADRNLGAQNRR